MGKKKLTIEFVREGFEKAKYTLISTEYKNNSTKLDYICPKGHKNSMIWNNFQRGQRCPDCAGIKKLTIEFVREQFQKEGYELLTIEYKNNNTKLDYICPKGHKNNIIWSDFQHGYRCSICAGNKKKTIEFIREQFQKEGYELLTIEYKNNETKLDYICDRGHYNNIMWSNFQRGQRCSECDGQKKKTIEFVREELKKEGYILISNEYKNNNTKLDYICARGHKNSITWHDFQHGNRCPDCAEHGFNPDKPGILYYLKLNSGLYKIGITNRTVKERYSVDDYKKFDSICIVHYEKGFDAYEEEQKILKENTEFKYNGPDVLKSGNTELFIKDIFS